jgi:hypothetical protein
MIFNGPAAAGLSNERNAMLDKILLDILCCPDSKAPLVQDGDFLVSTDRETRRRYRIEDDIPVLLIDESEQLDMAAWTEIMERTKAQLEK